MMNIFEFIKYFDFNLIEYIQDRNIGPIELLFKL